MNRHRFDQIVGIDPSMTSAGMAIYPVRQGEAGVQLSRVQSSAKDYQDTVDAKGKPASSYDSRCLRIRQHAERITAGCWRALVFMEGPSYGSAGSGTWDRAGLWWRIYHQLILRECTVVVVSPTQRMQYATGTGRADKDQVLAAVVKRYPHLEVRGNDVADALVFMAMGLRAIGRPLEDSLPAAHLKAMAKLDLTQLEVQP